MVSSGWTLFGIDLKPYVDQFKLATSQLLFGVESGLAIRFATHAKVIRADSESAAWLDIYGHETAQCDESDCSNVCALLLPEDIILERILEVPETAESQLADLVALEAGAFSPFAPEDTVFGWAVAERNKGNLLVRMAITSASEIQERLDREGDLTQPEVWAPCPQGNVQLLGYGEAVRRSEYLQRLLRLTGLASGFLAGIMIFAVLVSSTLSLQASSLDKELKSVMSRAAPAAETRRRLDEVATELEEATRFGNERRNYAGWLHALAAKTPDTVYLTAARFEDGGLEVRGLAVNAADYLSSLASSGLFSSVESPNAISVDRSTELERFTIRMALREDDVLHQVETDTAGLQ